VSLLLFAANCGNIIRRYCFAAKYALVAQPVEHLTFNQRARDSSSLERTKGKPTINRWKYGANRGFFCFTTGSKCPESALFVPYLRKNALPCALRCTLLLMPGGVI
jgi:hypothetical protein